MIAVLVTFMFSEFLKSERSLSGLSTKPSMVSRAMVGLLVGCGVVLVGCIQSRIK